MQFSSHQSGFTFIQFLNGFLLPIWHLAAMCFLSEIFCKTRVHKITYWSEKCFKKNFVAKSISFQFYFLISSRLHHFTQKKSNDIEFIYTWFSLLENIFSVVRIEAPLRDQTVHWIGAQICVCMFLDSRDKFLHMLKICQNDQKKWKNEIRTKGASLSRNPLTVYKTLIIFVNYFDFYDYFPKKLPVLACNEVST